MLPLRILEYLYYIGVFILLFKYSNGALVDLRRHPNHLTITDETPRSVDSTSTASSTTTTTSTSTPSVKKLLATTVADVSSIRPPVIQPPSSSSSGGILTENKLKQTIEDCSYVFSWLCLKIEFIQFLDRLIERDEVPIVAGISLVRDVKAKRIKNSQILAEVTRNFPNAGADRLNAYIVNKVNNYLLSHYLRFKLIDDQTIQQARSMLSRVEVGVSGRKGSGGGMGGGMGGNKKGGYEPLIAAGLMMKGTLMALGMGAVALVAGKAMMVALMALTIAAAVGIRGMAARQTTYEIVTKPIYTTSHTHSMSYDDGGHGHMDHMGTSGYGSYSRSIDLTNGHPLKSS